MPTSKRPEQGHAYTQKEKFLLKDHLFNETSVQALAADISHVYPAFKMLEFVHACTGGFPARELKARISWIAECLHTYLPESYPDAVQILIASLPPVLDPGLEDGDFGDFIHASYGEYISTYGLVEEHFKISVNAIHEITRRFSCEFAVRAFISTYPTQMKRMLATWAHDSNYHVRRLVSEGTRPRLPWGKKITVPYTYGLDLLEVLVNDPTRFVTRSVANHMNDISLHDPQLVLDFLTRHTDAPDYPYIAKHSLRTLISRGNSAALALQGHKNLHVHASSITTPSTVAIGDSLIVTSTISASTEGSALALLKLTTSGKIPGTISEKTYKIGIFQLLPHAPTSITKNITLRPGMTTKTFRLGPAKISLIVNGEVVSECEFRIS